MGITKFINNLGTVEIIVLIAIVFLLFGPKILKKLGKTGGETLKEVKNIKQTFKEALEDDDNNKSTTETIKKEV